MNEHLGTGDLVGNRWRIHHLLGEGGFGRVFAAKDESAVSLGDAAVKLLHSGTSPVERDNFLREVKKIAGLRHPNLVGYLDSGIHQQSNEGVAGVAQPFLVTELCVGSLTDLLTERRNRLTEAETLAILADLVAGLRHLHERNLVHRDIKPGNVLYADGNWKLADFGLMRDMSASGAYHPGVVIGTPKFMAPELFGDQSATERSDIYAVGVLAHMCLTGKGLHAGTGPALVHNIRHSPPEIDPSIDANVQWLIQRATAIDPAERPTAEQLQSLILQLRAGDSTTVVPVGNHGPDGRAATTREARNGLPTAAIAAAILAILAVVGGVVFALSDQGGDNQVSAGPGGDAEVAATDEQVDPTTTSPAAQPVAATVEPVEEQVATQPDEEPTQPVEPIEPEPTEEEVPGRELTDDPLLEEELPEEELPEEELPEEELPEEEQADESCVKIEGDVQIGGNVTIRCDEPVGVIVEDGLSHFDSTPCADGVPNFMRLTNSADVAVDYRVGVKHFDADGVRVSDRLDTVTALAPGESALVFTASTEDSAVSCEVEEFEARTTDPASLAAVASAELTSCILETDSVIIDADIVALVTNPLDVAADIDVFVAIYERDGLRVADSSFGVSAYDVAPGETVRIEESDPYWGLASYDGGPYACGIVSVEVRPW